MDIGIDKKAMGCFLGFMDPLKYGVALICRVMPTHYQS